MSNEAMAWFVGQGPAHCMAPLGEVPEASRVLMLLGGGSEHW